jgi:cysteine desulfurase
VDINVHSLGVDLLSASAHKFNGPKGIGFLYIRRGLKLEPYQNGGSQEFGLRAGTENVASIVGMAIALSRNVERIAEHRGHIEKLEERLLRRLEKGNIRFQRNGAAPRIPGNMSLSFEGSSGETLLHRLDLQGICISTGSA